MSTADTQKFNYLVDSIAREIVATEHRVGGSYIRTPLMYPSGSTVVVRIEQGDNRFFVSDVGLGFQEAELMGAGLMYSKPANAIATDAGVKFDNQASFVLEASREQLDGAVVGQHRPSEPLSDPIARWRAPFVLWDRSAPGPPFERKSPGIRVPNRPRDCGHVDDRRDLERHCSPDLALGRGFNSIDGGLPGFGRTFARSRWQSF